MGKIVVGVCARLRLEIYKINKNRLQRINDLGDNYHQRQIDIINNTYDEKIINARIEFINKELFDCVLDAQTFYK